MHDKYAYERIEMALHDHPVRRTMAWASRGSRSPRTACRRSEHARVKVVRDDSGLVVDYQMDGEFPAYGNNDNRADVIAVMVVRVHEQDPKVSDLPRMHPHPVGADHHLERRLRQGTGNTPDGRRKGEPFARAPTR